MMQTVMEEKQVLDAKRCPRCFCDKWKVRRVKAYHGEQGDVILYSCLACKRVIAMEIERGGEGNEILAGTGKVAIPQRAARE